jgi:hypothetical protein
MTTWGDVDQFKYFLPRILELLAPGLDWGPEIILGKLDYAGWRSWSKGEQAAVENYCRSLWSHVLTTAGCKAGGFLAGFAQICDDLQWFLTEWAQQLPQSPEATHGLLEFVVLDVGDDERGFTLLWLDMVGDGAIARSTVESGQARRFKLGPWWEERGEQERQVLDWVFSPTTISSLEGACTAHRIESEYDLEWTLKQLRGSSELYRLNRNA